MRADTPIDALQPPVVQGDDDVVLRCAEVNGDFSDVLIDTAAGDDSLGVQNSRLGELLATLGDGNDCANFSYNTFLSANLDGASVTTC